MSLLHGPEEGGGEEDEGGDGEVAEEERLAREPQRRLQHVKHLCAHQK